MNHSLSKKANSLFDKGRNSAFSLLAIGFSILMAGCGGAGEFGTSPVHGVVTFDGKPVYEGTIDFTPVPGSGATMQGKPSSARLSSDGTFKAGTYESSDGVVPGKKRVSYSAPLPEDSRDKAQSAPSPFAGMIIEPSEVEIIKGKNELAFTLKKAAEVRKP